MASEQIECPACGQMIDVAAAVSDAAMRKAKMAVEQARRQTQQAQEEAERVRSEMESAEALFNENLQARVEEEVTKKEAVLADTFSAKIKDAREQGKKSSEAELAVLLKENEQLKKEREEAKRKLTDKGNAQFGGLSQEEYVFESLRERFPSDSIRRAGVGAPGADVWHEVRNSSGIKCGAIYYESKRYSALFQGAWLKKFKNDLRKAEATVGMLVTNVTPGPRQREEIKQLIEDGIWVCDVSEFLVKADVLRLLVIKMHKLQATQKVGDDAKSDLFNLVTSDWFERAGKAYIESQRETDKCIVSLERTLEKLQASRKRERLRFTGLYSEINEKANVFRKLPPAEF